MSQKIPDNMPILPFYPGDGTTDCDTDCRCEWIWNTRDEEQGDYGIYWIMGPSKHCDMCIARARACSPLHVSQGVILNPEKYQNPALRRKLNPSDYDILYQRWVTRIQEIIKNLNDTSNQHNADGVIDEGEIAEANKLIENSIAELHNLKLIIIRSVLNIKTDFRGKQQSQISQPFLTLKSAVDDVLFQIENMKNEYAHIDNQADLLETSPQDNIDNPAEENTEIFITNDEAIALKTKWKKALNTANQRLQDDNLNEQQIAYYKGIKKALSIVLEDLELAIIQDIT